MSSEKEESRREEAEGQKNKEDNDNDNILTKEVVSWKGFEYALRQPNPTLFNKNVSRMSGKWRNA